jgi:hypothetical protein
LPEDGNKTPRPKLALIRGEGARRPEPIGSRNAAVRALVEVGADLLLKRITAERAEEIQKRIDRVLYLFDQVDSTPGALPELRRELDLLEMMMRETRDPLKRIKRRFI